ncbi:MocR-like pyridoxine biosynthesis transcription factor PdxR [Dendrosporobacter sp. 1207_IL3150]|uniref:MocR-like pyridoxine biosynthesis transcription factor PdxR n=1 Tax=Dendrosporobacter sp. 1207_IL3150 TaxID=3084054 RepID=UPI002FD89B23
MFVLSAKDGKPLYSQLYQQIRNNILSGDLKPGTKLSSSRHLSKELCVSRTTVDMAYQQLVSEGYLVGKPRSGYYIEALDNLNLPVFMETKTEEEAILNEPVKSPKYNLQYGKLETAIFPFRKWRQLTNKCLRDDKEQIMSYGPAQGEHGLRTAISEFLREYRGVECTANQIVICPGTQYCLNLAGQLIQPSTNAIAIENPGFWAARSIFSNMGFRIIPVPVKKHGLKVKQLRMTDAQAVYVTPSHQFPTGNIMSITRRLELVKWARESDSIIIEDDYSCHLRYNVRPIQALQALAPDQVIYIGSFSKILSPSIRVAYMVLPQKMVDRFLLSSEHFPCSVPFLIQKPLELFLKEGEWGSHLRKITRHMKKKRGILIQALKHEFGDAVSISGGNAGLHLLVQVMSQLSEQELVARAFQAGLLIHPAGNLWQDQSDAPFGTVLLGYGGIALEDIYPAVQLLRQAWLEDE